MPVTKPIPDYLKLHREEVESATFARDALGGLEGLRQAFHAVTGWRLQFQPAAAPGQGNTGTPPQLLLEGPADTTLGGPAGPREAVEALNNALNQLLGQLHATSRALWQREAELAAGVPVTPRPDEAEHLAVRLEAILRGGVESVGGDAAGLYLLDESTSHLKLRACWGLPLEKLAEPPRPLRGSAADLEALVGHAVVLEDTRLLPQWRAPEDFPAAVCVPVASPSLPLGTLWLFSHQPRDFSDRETQLLEIVAGRIAAELEREMLLAEAVTGKLFQQQVSRISQRRQRSAPTISPVLDNWDLAAWSAPLDALPHDLYDWGVLCDGRPYLALGSADGEPLDGALTVTALQTALRSETLHPHDPRQLLGRINETFWCSSAGDQFASLFYAILDTDTSRLAYAFAGRAHAFVVGPNGTRPLTRPAALLGLGPDAEFPVQKARLQADEVLVLTGPGIWRTREGQPASISMEQLGDLLRRVRATRTAEGLVQQLRDFLRHHYRKAVMPECTLLVARPR